MKKYDISRTTVLKAKKTAVLVFMPGLVDRSWSRTVPTLFVGWFIRFGTVIRKSVVCARNLPGRKRRKDFKKRRGESARRSTGEISEAAVGSLLRSYETRHA